MHPGAIPQPCILALHCYSPTLHPSVTAQTCIPVLHPNPASQCYIPNLHPSVTSQLYIPILHPSPTSQPCTPVLHPSPVSRSCIPSLIPQVPSQADRDTQLNSPRLLSPALRLPVEVRNCRTLGAPLPNELADPLSRTGQGDPKLSQQHPATVRDIPTGTRAR